MMNVANIPLSTKPDLASAGGKANQGLSASAGNGFSEALGSLENAGEKNASLAAEDEGAAGELLSADTDASDLDAAIDASAPVTGRTGRFLASTMPVLSTASTEPALPADQLAASEEEGTGMELPSSKLPTIAVPAARADSKQIADFASQITAALSEGDAEDIKTLVAAFKKQRDPLETPEQAMTDEEAVDPGEEAASPLDDMLVLLTGVSAQSAPQRTGTDLRQSGEPGTTLLQQDSSGKVSPPAGAEKVAASAAGTLETGSEPISGEGAVFRLQKGETSPTSVDLHIAPDADGKLDVDVTPSGKTDAPVIQVVESRRYLGLTPGTNASSVVSAMTADPEWSSALEPGMKLANAAAYTSTGKVVHTLKIQMNPVELGHVSATMRLVGEELSIQLTVHNSNAYRELVNDSSAILDGLRAQGFNIDQVNVTLSTASDRQDQNGAGGRQQDVGQQAQQQNRQGGEAGRQGEPSRQQAEYGNDRRSGNEGVVENGAAARPASGRPEHVYL